MRTRKAVIGYKALTQDFEGIHGTYFGVGTINELPDTRPQAGEHGYTFATSLYRLFQCFDTNKLPVVVEVVGYGETHIGRHLCATNHLFVTRVLGFHEVQEILNQEKAEYQNRKNSNTDPDDNTEVEPEQNSKEVPDKNNGSSRTERENSDMPIVFDAFPKPTPQNKKSVSVQKSSHKKKHGLLLVRLHRKIRKHHKR